MTTSEYSTHPLRATLQEVMQLQSDPAMHDPIVANDEEASFNRDKIFAMAEMVRSLLDSTPAVLASSHALNQINKHIRNALVELQNYISNKNLGHIASAANAFEQNVLQFLWGFCPQIQPLASPVPEIFESLTKSASETIKHLTAERDRLNENLLETSLGAEALKTRLDTMSEVAAKERAEAAAEVARLNQAFTEKEAERSASFETALSKMRDDFKQLEEGTKSNGHDLLAALEEQRGKAAQIVQVVGNIGVTGNYQTIAKVEADQANFWRWITVLFFVVGVSLALVTFIRFWGDPVTSESIWMIAIRLMYAIAITAPAWYTARESARHRTNADQAKQTELELASLGPFIELLPVDRKNEIREQMTKIYFGREVSPHESNHPLDLGSLKDFVVEVAKALRK